MQSVLDFPMELLHKDQAAFEANENTQSIALLQKRLGQLAGRFHEIYFKLKMLSY